MDSRTSEDDFLDCEVGGEPEADDRFPQKDNPSFRTDQAVVYRKGVEDSRILVEEEVSCTGRSAENQEQNTCHRHNILSHALGWITHHWTPLKGV